MNITLSWWFGLVVVIVVLLVIDLLVAGRSVGRPSTRSAACWVGGYCLAALAFAGVVLVDHGPEYAGQFVAAWLTEYSLSVDNLFVFLVLMTRFAVPVQLQLRVLTVGIVLALVLRAALIAVGAVVVARFSWVFVLFGVFLIWTAYGLLRENLTSGQHAEPGPVGAGQPAESGRGRVAGLLDRIAPTTPHWHGTRLTIRQEGRRMLTPMVVTLVAIGTTDLLFALDSIPATFGLTREPFLIVAANAFALMGLRQLYFLVEGLVSRLPLLGYGLATVLAFIGAKLFLQGLPFENLPHISVTTSLAVVIGVLTATTLAGFVIGPRPRAEAG